MNTLLEEHLLTISEAARQLPTKVSNNAIWRWCTRGVRGVKLESVKIGGTRFTSSRALRTFLERCNEEDAAPRLDQVEEQLANDGI